MQLPPGFELRGLTIEDTPLINPMTGGTTSHASVQVTAVDPRTGAFVIIDRRPAIQCAYGDVIPNGEGLAFCAYDGLPVCTRHSVIDPLCGRILCLHHSNLVTIQDIPYRVCPECFRLLNEGFLTRALKWLRGEK